MLRLITRYTLPINLPANYYYTTSFHEVISEVNKKIIEQSRIGWLRDHFNPLNKS
jgi:hypothetical protein